MKIGIDIGGSHVAVGLIDIYGKIVCKSEEDIDNNIGEEYFEKKFEGRQISFTIYKI